MEHQALFIQKLTEICSNYAGEKCYIGEIPNRVEVRIREKFEILEDQDILAFYDYTIFGYGKAGFVVAPKGIYWKELWKNIFIPWSRVASMKDIHISKGKIILDESMAFSLNACPLAHEKMLELFKNLRETTREFLAVEEERKEYSSLEGPQTLEQAIMQICQDYYRSKVYIGSIPEPILNRVRLSLYVPKHIQILVFIDFKLFNRGKIGVAFTKEGIYWRIVRRGFISWCDFRHSEITLGKSKLHLSSDKYFDLNCSPLKPQEWKDLLTRIGKLPQLAIERLRAMTCLTAVNDERVTFEQAIQVVLRPYLGDKVYNRNIPVIIYERIRKHFQIPEEIEIWGYVDFASFRGGKEGVVFTSIGLHWKIMFVGTGFISWSRLYKVDVTMNSKKTSLLFDSNQKLILHGSPISCEDWYNLLSQIQQLPQLASFSSINMSKRANDNHVDIVLDEQFIELICRAHSFFDRLIDYAFDSIKEEMVRYSFQLKEGEHLIALRDESGGRKGKFGLLITNQAVHIRNSSKSLVNRNIVIPLHELGKSLTKQGHSLYYREEKIYQSHQLASLLAMFNDIQLYVDSMKAKDNPVKYPYDPSYHVRWNLPVQESNDERWIVANDGMLIGIYTTSEIDWAAKTGQLDPWKTFFWRKGLPGWISAQDADFLQNK